jgi:hypothetical protein
MSIDPRNGGKPKNTEAPPTHDGMRHVASHDGVNVTAVGMSRTASAEALSGRPAPRSETGAAKKLTAPAVNPGMTRRSVHPNGAPVARSHPDNFAADVEAGATILANSVQAVPKK